MIGNNKKKTVSPRPAAVPGKLLHKIRPRTFTERDWERLIEACRDPRTRRALGHLPRITGRMVRQLVHVPRPLLRPRVLKVLNRLTLSPERWRTLQAALDEADSQRRATLAHRAGKIQAAGDLWDYWHEAVLPEERPFQLPADARASQLLEALSDPAAMRAEGQRMVNCLGQMARDVHARRTLAFRPRSLTQVTGELAAHKGAWQVGQILGPGNMAVSPEEKDPIHAELQRLADRLNQSAPPAATGLDSPSVLALCAWARTEFSTATRAHISQPLREILGRSVSPEKGAFAIFVAESRVYVQFMALPNQEFLCEVASHQYLPVMHTYLSEPVVTLLEQTGFRWPRGEENFSQYFLGTSEGEILAIADLTLALLARIGGLGQQALLTRKGHIPQQTAPSTPLPGWVAADGGLDLDDNVRVMRQHGGSQDGDQPAPWGPQAA